MRLLTGVGSTHVQTERPRGDWHEWDSLTSESSCVLFFHAEGFALCGFSNKNDQKSKSIKLTLWSLYLINKEKWIASFAWDCLYYEKWQWRHKTWTWRDTKLYKNVHIKIHVITNTILIECLDTWIFVVGVVLRTSRQRNKSKWIRVRQVLTVSGLAVQFLTPEIWPCRNSWTRSSEQECLDTEILLAGARSTHLVIHEREWIKKSKTAWLLTVLAFISSTPKILPFCLASWSVSIHRLFFFNVFEGIQCAEQELMNKSV